MLTDKASKVGVLGTGLQEQRGGCMEGGIMRNSHLLLQGTPSPCHTLH